MNADIPKQTSIEMKSFRDFVLFSVFVVRPGTVFTPREKDKSRRSRVTSLRRPTPRTHRSAWDRLQVAYIGACDTRTALIRPKKAEEAIDPEVTDEWAANARRTRLSWMDENPY